MRVLIELPTWLGDCVMATPAIENIASIYPEAELTFVGSAVAIAAVKHHPQTQAIQVLDKPYLLLYRVARSLGRFDIFISFRSSTRSKIFGFFILADRKYQFNKYKYGQGHQVEKYNDFVNDSLGVNTTPGRLALCLGEQSTTNPSTSIVGINPGASYGSAKRWYPEEFAKVSTMLSDRYDVVIFGGPGEVDMAADIENGLQRAGVTNYQNLAGKTNVPELIQQISQLDLFITGDSGPMHVAAAFQVPTVAIFGPTKDKETSQWMNDKSVIVKKNLDCQPCMKRTCPLKHHDCMRLIGADEVLVAVKQLNL